MPLQSDALPSRVAPLVHYCYRFINSHLDSIESVGDVPYSLIEPVLRSCSAEKLLSLEKNSPHLKCEDQDIWKRLCFRDFPRLEWQFEKGEVSEPESWREQYFEAQALEEKRLEEVGSRIKIRRQEAEEERKERQIIYTDKLPPAKRARLNSGASRPRTLLEKARAESIKIQRTVYGPAILPPIRAAKPTKPRFMQPKSSVVTHRETPGTNVSANVRHHEKPQLSTTNSITTRNSGTPPEKVSATGPPTGAAQTSPKKDIMATLFMPKHKAHSQLPTNTPISVRARK